MQRPVRTAEAFKITSAKCLLLLACCFTSVLINSQKNPEISGNITLF